MSGSPAVCSIEGCGKSQLARGWCSSHYGRWRFHGDPLGGKTFAGESERYFREVVLSFVGDGCLIWPYSKDFYGYGKMRRGRCNYYVHRLTCEAVHGPPPAPEHEATHSCGHGHEGCCNPAHIRWASRAENEADKLVHGTHGRGEQSSSAKLTEADVLVIRGLCGKISQREIAEKFGVGQAQVSRIHCGNRWSWL